MAIQKAVLRVADTIENNQKLFRRLTGGLKDLAQEIAELNLQFNSSLSEDLSDQSPSIVNFRFSPVEGEVMLHHLEEREIYVGLGSACSAHSKEPSKILTGIGLSPEEARCSLRISWGPQNTVEDVDAFLKIFGEAYLQLFPTFKNNLTRR